MKKLFTIIVMLLAMNASGQWQPDVRLTNAPGNSNTSANNAWCIASNGNFLHVVWFDNRDNSYNSEIYYKRSTDGGINWGADIRLTNSNYGYEDPSIAVSDSCIHVVWNVYRNGNYEIYYKRSTDGGINWGPDIRLTNYVYRSEDPSIAVYGSFVHVVWRDDRDGNREIYYKRSIDGGLNWDADTRLTNNTSSSEYPSIAISDSCIHVVWNDYRNGNHEIYYKRSTDGGINWGADVRLTNNIYSSEYPSIAVYGSIVHVLWKDDRDGNQEIYYKRSTDGGLTWDADTRLTNCTADSRLPSVAVSGTLVHVVWTDERFNVPDSEIYYKRSTDSGINWGEDSRLTNASSTSYKSSIAVSDSIVHIVWTDWRSDGNAEIYYKRNPTGNLIAIQNTSTEIPSSYTLSQNYPNPFNPVTKIKFAMPKAGDTKIVVYDVMGREVQTLVNERLQPGTYEATFDGSALNSGVYFYKLTTEGFTETKRMLMIK